MKNKQGNPPENGLYVAYIDYPSKLLDHLIERTNNEEIK